MWFQVTFHFIITRCLFETLNSNQLPTTTSNLAFFYFSTALNDVTKSPITVISLVYVLHNEMSDGGEYVFL